MRFLITAGPTREHLDPVRYLSNASTGAMGFAFAEAARDAGHRVVLVSGPVSLPDPKGVRTIRVVSAREMRREVLRVFPRIDAVVMTAAVSDYRPRRASPTKLKRSGKENLSLELVPNPDILAELGRRKGNRILTGFALETGKGKARALGKLRRKNLDYIVLDDPAAIGARRVTATVFRGEEEIHRFSRTTKKSLARWVVREMGRGRP